MAVAEICAVFIIIILSWMYFKSKKRYHLPPGPDRTPIFGNALQFDFNQFGSQMAGLGKNYTDAYTVKLFTEEIVVLNSYEFIQELMMSAKYAAIVSGRPPTFLREHYLRSDELFQTYSEKWLALRKIVSRGLKMYGSNLREVEDLVQEELEQILDRVQGEAGTIVDPYDYISGYIVGIMLMLLTGEHVKAADPLIELCSAITNDGDDLAHPKVAGIMTFMPVLGYIPFGYGKVFQRFKGNYSLLEKTIHEHRKTSDSKKPCFLDFMLKEQEAGSISAETVSGVFLDILVAGISTTRSTLYSLLLILTARPDVQEKIQEEIDLHMMPHR